MAASLFSTIFDEKSLEFLILTSFAVFTSTIYVTFWIIYGVFEVIDYMEVKKARIFTITEMKVVQYYRQKNHKKHEKSEHFKRKVYLAEKGKVRDHRLGMKF
ncbi:unnamed protein product [Caenorhabditis angaria]|uniref:Uncharacterized protein n=1 Tax=Caenorhabditis angaria TaxID=860376 RepID=A0A9P1IIA0_9PELO|nr:unnamed protein product [Caenorhabditis angaria]